MNYLHWDLRDTFSIKQVAALYFEVEPQDVFLNSRESEIVNMNSLAELLAKHAEKLFNPFVIDEPQSIFLERDVDGSVHWDKTFLTRGALIEFFQSKNQRPKFLFHSENNDSEELFDKAGTSYPPELDLAIQAWRAATASEGKGKPKAKIKAWLDANTKLSNEAKERIAIVANWEKTGGATTTG